MPWDRGVGGVVALRTEWGPSISPFPVIEAMGSSVLLGLAVRHALAAGFPARYNGVMLEEAQK